MRDYSHIDGYLSELLDDIYPNPPDPVHTELTQEVITQWISKIVDLKTVLDIGCGEAFAQPMFEELGIVYTGVAIGQDYVIAKRNGRNVYQYDMSFLPFEDKSFDLVFSRHSIEHSPFPLISMMEWHRVAKAWLCVIAPTPSYWGRTGRNHYSVLSASQIRFLADRAGWGGIWENMDNPTEFRFLFQRKERIALFDDNTAKYEVTDAPPDAVQPV